MFPIHPNNILINESELSTLNKSPKSLHPIDLLIILSKCIQIIKILISLQLIQLTLHHPLHPLHPFHNTQQLHHIISCFKESLAIFINTFTIHQHSFHQSFVVLLLWNGQLYIQILYTIEQVGQYMVCLMECTFLQVLFFQVVIDCTCWVYQLVQLLTVFLQILQILFIHLSILAYQYYKTH